MGVDLPSYVSHSNFDRNYATDNSNLGGFPGKVVGREGAGPYPGNFSMDGAAAQAIASPPEPDALPEGAAQRLQFVRFWDKNGRNPTAFELNAFSQANPLSSAEQAKADAEDREAFGQGPADGNPGAMNLLGGW